MTISFGQPGRPRKSIVDNKFELINSSAHRTPAKIGQLVPAGAIEDGLIVAMDANGDYGPAPDAARSLRMIFTGNSTRMNHAYEPRVGGEGPDADEYLTPGADPSDTVTALMGHVEGIWPAALLFTGRRDNDADGPNGVDITLASYTRDTALTVVNGRLAPANVGGFTNEPVVGHVIADANLLGSQAIQAAIDVH